MPESQNPKQYQSETPTFTAALVLEAAQKGGDYFASVMSGIGKCLIDCACHTSALDFRVEFIPIPKDEMHEGRNLNPDGDDRGYFKVIFAGVPLDLEVHQFPPRVENFDDLSIITLNFPEPNP